MSLQPRREFIIRLATGAAALGSGVLLSACGGAAAATESPEVRFDHGIASGDPLADRVILWTHARFADGTADVPLRWEVATDAGFGRVVASGSVTATAAAGYTAKADAAGLAAGTEYHYRFSAGRWRSPVGRTRTLPADGVDEVRLAVLSCANWPEGFFHPYAEAARSGAQYAVHLGDYIYEYGFASAPALARDSDPPHELLTLADYRRRYAQYRSDVALRLLHASMPMIAAWDDHEIANDTWREGAQNHTEGAEGSFVARRAAAVQAWHEWMPVRSGDDPLRTWRSFRFGRLLELHMLDARAAGRDRQLPHGSLRDPATAAAAWAALLDPKREMLGAVQAGWLQAQLAASPAVWQVLGQQVPMARMEVPRSTLPAVLQDDASPAGLDAGRRAVADLLAAQATPVAARTPAQQALVDPVANPRIPLNMDAWDGYPLARERLLAAADRLGRRLVVLAGDTHNAWHSDLRLAGLLDPARAGRKVGEEFATTSVSSTGLELSRKLPPAEVKAMFEALVGDLRWMEPAHRGFLRMTFTAAEARGDWFFVDTTVQRDYKPLPRQAGDSRSWPAA